MSTNHLAAIHVLRAQLRLTDDDYRALLRQLTGHNSSKDCSQQQRAMLREHMQRLAVRMGVARPSAGRADQRPSYARAARPMERKLWALWSALGRDGKLDAPGPVSLQAWVKRQTGGVDHVRFCTDAQLHALIEALKGWEGRA